MSTMFTFLFVLLAASCLSGLVVTQMLLSRMRKWDSAAWVELGKPVAFLNSGALNSVRLIKFLWRRDYEGSSDRGTVVLGRFVRGFMIYYIILFGAIIFLAFFRGQAFQ